MSAFSPLPLGSRIPNRLHAVSVSLPTMRDLRGYEERDPATLKQMPSGYPRFVVHPLVRELAARLAAKEGLKNQRLWLTSSAKMADRLLDYLHDPSARVFCCGDICGVSHSEDPSFASRAKSFLQHTGGFLSSRRAEDELLRLGLIPSIVQENLCEGNAGDIAWTELSPFLGKATRKDSFLASSGINTVYAGFRALSAIQQKRGRSIWIQLGWLYLDTIAILQKFTPGEHGYRHVRQVDDRAALEKLFKEEGDKIAGIIAEVPNNPLIQTPDLPWLYNLAQSHGARLVIDPSVASIYAVDLLPYSDLLACSLTKYSSHEGDVIAGLAVVNPEGPDAAALREELGKWIEPIYLRDLSRLAAQLKSAPKVFARIEQNLCLLARHLESRPEVSRVHWTRAPRTGRNFEALARSPSSNGGMLSFELNIPMEPFFDALRLPKGPSFGMSTSLVCPFIWLGHYDLVTSPEGRAELAASKINCDLVRLSVGAEPIADIIGAIDEALEKKNPVHPNGENCLQGPAPLFKKHC
jgi:cystathionine gamma-synthase